MPEPIAIVVACAAALLAYTVLASQRHRRRVAELRSEIDDLEAQNRRLHDERRSLGEELAQTRSRLEELSERHRALESEHAELDRKRHALEETATRLEKARAELEATVSALQSRHAALESRVLEFQGAWDQQMSTLEEEIATLGRQLGEFRKGTRLPIPPRDHRAA